MESFFDSVECRSGSHCQTCRAKIGGSVFRASIAYYFTVGQVDWECPHGRPWGLDCQAESLPMVATRSVEICRECDEFNGAVCELKFPNGCCICTWNKFLQEGNCPMPIPRWTNTLSAGCVR